MWYSVERAYITPRIWARAEREEEALRDHGADQQRRVDAKTKSDGQVICGTPH